MASYMTEYSIFRVKDYKSCVCYYWAPDLTGCVDGTMPSTQ